MRQLGLTDSGLARLCRLGRHGRKTVFRWKRGENDIPGYVSLLMDAYIENNGQLPDITPYTRGPGRPPSSADSK